MNRSFSTLEGGEIAAADLVLPPDAVAELDSIGG
jgi:hypothetical protein